MCVCVCLCVCVCACVYVCACMCVCVCVCVCVWPSVGAHSLLTFTSCCRIRYEAAGKIGGDFCPAWKAVLFFRPHFFEPRNISRVLCLLSTVRFGLDVFFVLLFVVLCPTLCSGLTFCAQCRCAVLYCGTVYCLLCTVYRALCV